MLSNLTAYFWIIYGKRHRTAGRREWLHKGEALSNREHIGILIESEDLSKGLHLSPTVTTSERWADGYDKLKKNRSAFYEA